MSSPGEESGVPNIAIGVDVERLVYFSVVDFLTFSSMEKSIMSVRLISCTNKSCCVFSIVVNTVLCNRHNPKESEIIIPVPISHEEIRSIRK